MKEGRKPEYPEKTPGDELHVGSFMLGVSLLRQSYVLPVGGVSD